MQLSEAIILAFISSGVTFLVAMLVQRPRTLAEVDKIKAEKILLSDQSDRDTIRDLTTQLSEARVSITKYRRRLRDHGFDPDSDTGPLKTETGKT